MQSLTRQLKRGNSIIISDSMGSQILTKKKNGSLPKNISKLTFRVNHPDRNCEQEKYTLSMVTQPLTKAITERAKINGLRSVTNYVR